MADRFEDLRNYVAVVTNGGVNAAADALGIAKSAVSRRLSDLETRLGVTLIDRTTRRLELTAVGRDYHRRATELLASLDALDTSVTGEAASPERITVEVADLLVLPVASALAKFSSTSRHLSFEISGSTPRTAPTGAALLVTCGAGDLAGRESRPLGQFKLVLCAAPEYLKQWGTPTASSELSGHVGIAIGSGDNGWMLDGSSRQEFNAALTVPDATAATAAAIEGGGLVQLPEFMIRNALEDDRLRRVVAGRSTPTVEVSAHYLSESSTSVRQVVDYLAARIDLKG